MWILYVCISICIVASYSVYFLPVIRYTLHNCYLYTVYILLLQHGHNIYIIIDTHIYIYTYTHIHIYIHTTAYIVPYSTSAPLVWMHHLFYIYISHTAYTLPFPPRPTPQGEAGYHDWGYKPFTKWDASPRLPEVGNKINCFYTKHLWYMWGWKKYCTSDSLLFFFKSICEYLRSNLQMVIGGTDIQSSASFVWDI